jgi:SAM-dependent methyltransferase
MARIRATRRDLVLDAGSGSHPHSTADILVERFLEDEIGHRSHTLVSRERPLVCADIQALPFPDKAFDYVVCNHVLEHVENPAQALDELARVAKRGYLALPSEFYEFVCPTHSHKWVFALSDGTLLVKRRGESHHLGMRMYGGLFFTLYALPEFKRLTSRRSKLFGVTMEWEGTIPYRLLGDNEPFYDYSNPEAVRELIELTLPDSFAAWVRVWLNTSLTPERMHRLTRLRGKARQFMKKLRL